MTVQAMGVARIIDPSQTLIFPALGPIYQCLAPWAEAALRAVVGLWLVPHALRNTFGFFPTTGVRANNLTALAAQLDRDGYRPGKLWAPAISITQLVGGPLLALGLFTRPAAFADPAVPPGHQRRALAGRKILLESARPRIHPDVDGRDVLFPGTWRRTHLARPPHRPRILRIPSRHVERQRAAERPRLEAPHAAERHGATSRPWAGCSSPMWWRRSRPSSRFIFGIRRRFAADPRFQRPDEGRATLQPVNHRCESSSWSPADLDGMARWQAAERLPGAESGRRGKRSWLRSSRSSCLLPLLDVMAYLAGPADHPSVHDGPLWQRPSHGMLPLLWLAIVVSGAGRGGNRLPRIHLPRLGPALATADGRHPLRDRIASRSSTSQYNWFGILQVFLIGLLLTWTRWRSGSMLLPMLLALHHQFLCDVAGDHLYRLDKLAAGPDRGAPCCSSSALP